MRRRLTPSRLAALVAAPRTRAVLGLGIALGLTSVNTLAYWTDEAAMTTGQIQSGSLDLLIDGQLSGQGGSVTRSAINASSMLPGESFAFTVPVQRAPNTAGFAVTATATSAGALAAHLRWSVHEGTAGTQTVGANSIRSNTCGGTQLSDNVALGASGQVVIPTTNPVNLGGATLTKNLCIRVTLPSSAPNAAQSTSATATFNLTATQLQ